MNGFLELEPTAVREREQLEDQISEMRLAQTASMNLVQFAKQNVELQLLTGNTSMVAVGSEVDAAKEKLKQSQQEVVALEAENRQKLYEKEQAERLYPRGLVSEQKPDGQTQFIECCGCKT